MKNHFSKLAFWAVIFLTGCSCNHSNSNAGTENSTTTVSANNPDSENVILRDSVTVLKYKSQSDTIVFPVINPRYAKLTESLSVAGILGEDLYQVKTNYAGCGCGYIHLDYKETFSNTKIISLVFNTAFVGPYPSETTIYQTLKINTGSPYKLTDQLNQEGLGYVLKKYKETLLNNLEIDKKNHTEEDYESAYNQIKENISRLTFDAINQNYIVNHDSITVKTEPILPHVTMAWEINRKVNFSLDELKQFKKAGASI